MTFKTNDATGVPIDWSQVTGVSEETRAQGLRLAVPRHKSAPATPDRHFTLAEFYDGIQPDKALFWELPVTAKARPALARKNACADGLVEWFADRLGVAAAPGWTWITLIEPHDEALWAAIAKATGQPAHKSCALLDRHIGGTYSRQNHRVNLALNLKGGALTETVAHELLHASGVKDEPTAYAFGSACRSALRVPGSADDSGCMTWVSDSDNEPGLSSFPYAKWGDTIITRASSPRPMLWGVGSSSWPCFLRTLDNLPAALQ